MGEMLREDELKRNGWVQRFTTSEPRLSEVVELYESIVFEVPLEPLSPSEEEAECKVCFKGTPDKYRTVYTRPKK